MPVVDVDGEGEGAHGVGDGVHGRVPQHRRDPVSVVSGLAPARDLHETCNICNIVLYCTVQYCTVYLHVQVEPGGVPLRV